MEFLQLLLCYHGNKYQINFIRISYNDCVRLSVLYLIYLINFIRLYDRLIYTYTAYV